MSSRYPSRTPYMRCISAGGGIDNPALRVDVSGESFALFSIPTDVHTTDCTFARTSCCVVSGRKVLVYGC